MSTRRELFPSKSLRTGNARGAALIELAIALPFLLLLMTGLFTFGVAMNNYLMLTDAASIGGRTIAVSRSETTDPCKTVSTAVLGVAPLLKSSNMKMTMMLNGTTVYGPLGTLPASCNSTSTTSPPASYLTQGGTAQVTITYPCKLEAFGINYAPSCKLTAQTTEVVQ